MPHLHPDQPISGFQLITPNTLPWWRLEVIGKIIWKRKHLTIRDIPLEYLSCLHLCFPLSTSFSVSSRTQ